MNNEQPTESQIKKYEQHKWVAKLIRTGLAKWEIIERIIVQYKISSKESEQLYNEVEDLLADEYKNYMSAVVETNIGTLMQIRNECLEDGSRKVALEAVRELNRVCKVYENKVKLDLDDVTIKFN